MAGPQNTSAKGRVGPEDLEELLEEKPSLREVAQLRADAGRFLRAIGRPHLVKVGMAIFRRFYDGEDKPE